MNQVPVIDVTDLYHPPEDPGDNVDLVAAYGLPEVDLRAVVLDAWDRKRDSVNEGVPNFPGPRDPGVIPVTQLNAVFGRQVPYGIGPFIRMRSLDDEMRDVPVFQQAGVELILRTLRAAEQPVHILSFGSARTIAVAFNREPELLRATVAKVHLSAGTTTPTYMEWNVSLDPIAIRRVLGSGLPVALYPCATVDSCYADDEHNTHWRMETMTWVEDLAPQLRRYLSYALSRSSRPDFLRALQEDPGDEVHAVLRRSHDVWETAIWQQVTGRVLVRRADGSAVIVRQDEVSAGDHMFRSELVPCRVRVRDDGQYVFDTSSDVPNAEVFRRAEIEAYVAAMNSALPALYRSFTPTGWR